MKRCALVCMIVGVLASAGCSGYNSRESQEKANQRFQETRDQVREDLKRADAQTREDLDKARQQLHQALDQSKQDLQKAQKDLRDRANSNGDDQH